MPKTKPIFVNTNNFFGKLILIVYSIIFSQKKALIQNENFKADFYPMILAIKE